MILATPLRSHGGCCLHVPGQLAKWNANGHCVRPMRIRNSQCSGVQCAIAGTFWRRFNRALFFFRPSRWQGARKLSEGESWGGGEVFLTFALHVVTAWIVKKECLALQCVTPLRAGNALFARLCPSLEAQRAFFSMLILVILAPCRPILPLNLRNCGALWWLKKECRPVKGEKAHGILRRFIRAEKFLRARELNDSHLI